MIPLTTSSTSVVDTPIAAITVPVGFQRIVRLYGECPAVRSDTDGSELTLAELDGRVRPAALGVSKVDTIAPLLLNTPECHVIDYAAAIRATTSTWIGRPDE